MYDQHSSVELTRTIEMPTLTGKMSPLYDTVITIAPHQDNNRVEGRILGQPISPAEVVS